MSISVLILTRNEEIDLPACLESVGWCDDIVVFDSKSTDRTEEIARNAGARFFERHFDNDAAQRNAALTEVAFKHPWVFCVDADERIPPELHREALLAVESAAPEVVAFRLRFKNYFFGRWIRRASLYPTWVIRLFRPDRVRYEHRLAHPYAVVNGELRTLQHHFHHMSFNKGLTRWFERHNQYSSMEAIELTRSLQQKLDMRGLLSSDPLRRRRAWKRLAFRLPARPLLVFIFVCFIRRGCLDGRPGITHCVLRSIYEYMIDVKAKELRRREKGLVV